MFKLKSVMARMSLNCDDLHCSEISTGENFTISLVHVSVSATVKFSYLSSASSGGPIAKVKSILDLSVGQFLELFRLPKTMLLVSRNGCLKFSESSNVPDTHS